ncbi:hypothetical protein, partial [Clostridium perfringens]
AYTGKIYPAVGQLKAGANELNKGINQLVSGVSDSTKSTAMIQNLLDRASKSTNNDEKNQLIQQAMQKTQEIQANAVKSAPEVKKLIEGASRLDNGLNGLYANLDPNTSEFGLGLKAIADNTGNLNAGLNKLNAGATQLNDGTSALKSNMPELSSG